MKRVRISTKQMAKFAGKWVVIDPKKDMIIAVGETFADISSLVVHKRSEKLPPVGELPHSFLVPRKGEGPYIL